VRSEVLILFSGRHIDWPITNFFGTLGMPPIEAPLRTHLQNKNKCAPLDFSLSTGELNFVQTICDKTQVLLGTSWATYLGT